MDKFKIKAITILALIILIFFIAILIFDYNIKKLTYNHEIEQELIDNKEEIDSLYCDINEHDSIIIKIKTDAGYEKEKAISADNSTTIKLFKELVEGD